MYTIIVLILLGCIVAWCLYAIATIIPYVAMALFVLWPFIAVGYVTDVGSAQWWIGGTIACISWMGLIGWIGNIIDSEKPSRHENYDDWLRKNSG
jgi:hypothetical protein